MKPISKLSLYFLLMSIVVALIGRAEAQENLLRNPGFEGDYFAWNGIPEVQVAHDWTPWWVEDVNRDPRWHRPEWKRALASLYPNRVRSGASAQQWFTFHASHYAGMYQQVFNVTPGQTYRFSVWVQVWSSLEDNAFESVSPANPHFQVGIEPNGIAVPGWAWPPGSIIWSHEAPMDVAIDGWALMSVEAVAQSETITVYLRTNPDFANKHNDMYIDEAQLIAVNPAPPPPTATSETAPATAPPPPPTAAPTLTSSPLPPTPTILPPATATATPSPEPTQTPTAPATPSPEPTATDEPPTATPTAEPTATAEPSPTAQAVAAAGDDAATDPEIFVEGAGNESPGGSPNLAWWWLLLLLPAVGVGYWIGRRRNGEANTNAGG